MARSICCSSVQTTRIRLGEALVAAGFDENGGLDDDDSMRIGRDDLPINSLLAADHRRVNQGVEGAKPIRISEDPSCQPFAVDVPGRRRAPPGRTFHHRRIGLSAGQQNLMTQLVRLDQVTAERRQGWPTKLLPLASPPVKPDFQHRPASRAFAPADPLCSAISMAMVSGPTPPGHGRVCAARLRAMSPRMHIADQHAALAVEYIQAFGHMRGKCGPPSARR